MLERSEIDCHDRQKHTDTRKHETRAASTTYCCTDSFTRPGALEDCLCRLPHCSQGLGSVWQAIVSSEIWLASILPALFLLFPSRFFSIMTYWNKDESVFKVQSDVPYDSLHVRGKNCMLCLGNWQVWLLNAWAVSSWTEHVIFPRDLSYSCSVSEPWSSGIDSQ